MYGVILAVLLLVAVILIAAVLLQAGTGGGLAAMIIFLSASDLRAPSSTSFARLLLLDGGILLPKTRSTISAGFISSSVAAGT